MTKANLISSEFLSTLSLRRATLCFFKRQLRFLDFYPRSPCGERHTLCLDKVIVNLISIHALLAESDIRCKQFEYRKSNISIHALLAESDKVGTAINTTARDFYPRSPCGERLLTLRL